VGLDPDPKTIKRRGLTLPTSNYPAVRRWVSCENDSCSCRARHEQESFHETRLLSSGNLRIVERADRLQLATRNVEAIENLIRSMDCFHVKHRGDVFSVDQVLCNLYALEKWHYARQKQYNALTSDKPRYGLDLRMLCPWRTAHSKDLFSVNRGKYASTTATISSRDIYPLGVLGIKSITADPGCRTTSAFEASNSLATFPPSFHTHSVC
jgi:hypothetical protein